MISEYELLHPEQCCPTHGILWIVCFECTKKERELAAIRWFDNQRNRIVTEQDRIEAHNKYVSLCGDPIESEQFH